MKNTNALKNNRYRHLVKKLNTVNDYLEELYVQGIVTNLQQDAYLYSLIILFLRDITDEDLEEYKKGVLAYYNDGDINAISWSINDLFARL